MSNFGFRKNVIEIFFYVWSGLYLDIMIDNIETLSHLDDPAF